MINLRPSFFSMAAPCPSLALVVVVAVVAALSIPAYAEKASESSGTSASSTSSHSTPSAERLVGWKGENYNADEGRHMLDSEKQAQEFRERNAWYELLSYKPKSFFYHRFLSVDECDYLVELARPRVSRSKVVDSVTGQIKEDPIRTSFQTFLTRGSDPVLSRVEERIAQFVGVPAYHGEDMQILRYQNGQKYDDHHDIGPLNSESGKRLAADGGQRMATALLYLSDVEECGETVFPIGEWKDQERKIAGGPYSPCGARGPAVRPQKGDMLIFWSTNGFGEMDQFSLHSGCPVIKGEKWTATKWIHQGPFR